MIHILPPLISHSIVFANTIALMAISSTLTLSKTNVPNFAVATFGTVGIYIAFTCVKLIGLGLYLSIPFCFFGGGVVGVLTYLLVIKPLRKRGATSEELMISTLALDIFLIALINIYADYLTRSFKIMARDFTFSVYDKQIFGMDGVFVISTSLFFLIFIALHLLFTRTNLGVAMKAMGEKPFLAECDGVNTELLYLITWFIAGALPALAGVFFPVYWISNPTISLFVVVTVFSGCVLGGFTTMYDSALGGYIVAIAQTALVSYLSSIFGSWILSYNFLVPLLTMIVVIFVLPEGIKGLKWEKLAEILHREGIPR
ncbi:MAG TPA: branched-chain amino acid ABC transporter permease [Candidatus Korarchaeota archaeon]|nr:branched-chain amino acid ABC transporter permease [Candidatus Korarchaeota archaeon]